MKKYILTFILSAGTLCAMQTQVSAQQAATETTINVNKEASAGYTMPIEAAPDAVETTLDDYFRKTFNTKPSTSKGFKIYKGVVWNEVSSEKVDVYFKAEGRKNKTTLNLLVSKGYNNFISSQTDAETSAKIITFMNGVTVKVNEYLHSQEIAEQTKKVSNAQDDYNKYVKRADELKKDKEKIEKDIAENQKKLQEREKELNEQKSKLEGMKK